MGRWKGLAMKHFHWHNKNNFGDMLGPELVEWIAGKRPARAERGEQGKLLTVGSVAHLVRPGDVVWGAGWMRPEVRAVDGSGVRFLAVRGPKTRRRIRGAVVPEVYGDPALLLPLMVPAATSGTAHLWVPHMVDQQAQPRGTTGVLDITSPWRRVVAAISSARSVTSSSLHAIVCAEAYGVPACWMPCDGVIGGPLKFRDYLAGTDRDPNVLQPGVWLPPIANLGEIQQRLLTAAEPLKEILNG